MADQQPVFPDAVGLIRAWLDEQLDVPVLGELLNRDDPAADAGRPPVFVSLELAGGAQANQVTDEARIIVEAWAQTGPAAHDLAQDARVLTKLLPAQGGPVNRIREIAGPGHAPDPVSKRDRFRFQIAARVRGAAYELTSS